MTTLDLARAEARRLRETARAENRGTCLTCGEPFFFYPTPHGLIEGQIRSRRGKGEAEISRTCEFCFDRIMRGPDEPNPEALEKVTGGISHILYDVSKAELDGEAYDGTAYEIRTSTREIDRVGTISSELDGKPGKHTVVLDIDVPARLVPSSTPGHHHLWIDVEVDSDDYFELLLLLARLGIIEPGYAGASIARGGTHVRAPWIHKGESES